MRKIPGGLLMTLMMSGLWSAAHAAPIVEVEPNDTIATAQNIDASFSIGANPDIADATTIPWVSIDATGNGTFDYYSFFAGAGATGVFDIDYGFDPADNPTFDSELFLYDLGGVLLDLNDDAASVTDGAGGSISIFDSFLTYSFTTAGTYVIGVGRFNSVGDPGGITGDVPRTGDTYTLQVSISETQDVPEPGTLALLGLGLAGLGFARRKKF